MPASRRRCLPAIRLRGGPAEAMSDETAYPACTSNAAKIHACVRASVGVFERSRRQALAADQFESGACVIVDAHDKPRRYRLRQFEFPDLRAPGQSRHRARVRSLADRAQLKSRWPCASAVCRTVLSPGLWRGRWLAGPHVDRFGDVLAAQITTAGMERMKDDIAAALGEK